MILAAGEGRRMLPLTQKTPKPLLKVGGQTLIERHLTRLRRAGFKEVVVNVSHLGALIERFLGDGKKWDLNITISREEEPLETGGGIVNALPLLGSEPFLVISSDIYTDFDLTALSKLKVSDNGAHLVLVPNPQHHPTGDFVLRGRQIRAAEDLGSPQAKGLEGGTTSTFSGIGVYSRAFFDQCKVGKFPLRSLMLRAIRARSLTGELFDGYWTDVGTPDRLKILNEYLDTQLAER